MLYLRQLFFCKYFVFQGFSDKVYYNFLYFFFLYFQFFSNPDLDLNMQDPDPPPEPEPREATDAGS